MRMHRYRQARRAQAGFTLLEYCAGAALVAGMLWGAFTLLGNSFTTLLTSLGSWVNSRAAQIEQAK